MYTLGASGHSKYIPLRHSFARWAVLFLAYSLLSVAHAQTTAIEAVRVGPQDQGTRIVFELDALPNYNVFTLNNPSRVVIDFTGARFNAQTKDLKLNRTAIKQIRHAQRSSKQLRIVVDLSQSAVPKSFVLPPRESQKHRLVVDLQHSRTGNVAKQNSSGTSNASQDKTLVVTAPTASSLRQIVVAIDAGHGGKDPGAIGRSGTREKDVVLAIAKRLAKKINADPRMRAVMIRDRDRFLTLRGRIKRARDKNADVFLSIHADAAVDRRARGSSVYVLSKHGASSEAARILAKRENSVDSIGGVNLETTDEMVAEVIVDLIQNNTVDESTVLAQKIIGQLSAVGKTKKKVEHAGFAVLKSPDIPSVLVETAFISNPTDEKRLRSGGHQEKLAQAIFRGLKGYLRNHAPTGTQLASTPTNSRHTIRHGETLSGIAQRYQVNVKAIRSANALATDRIRVGQVLVIPSNS